MTVQLTLGQCGVAPLVRGQDGTAPGPVPRRAPPYAIDCDSDSLAVARTTGHLVRIAHWNAEGVRLKKNWNLNNSFRKIISTSAVSRRRILTVPSDSTYEDKKYTEMTEKIDPKEESPLLSKQNTVRRNIQIPGQ